MSAVVLTDEVIDQIKRSIADHQPERGGALLGPVGVPAVTSFLDDAAADSTTVTYRSSRWLAATVRTMEKENPLIELKGIVHSHPGRLNSPSSQDLVAFADSLQLNPWLGSFVAPIVVRHPRDRHAPEQIGLGEQASLTMWVAQPTAGDRNPGSLLVTSRPALVLPACRDLAAVAHHVGAGQGTTRLAVIELSSQPVLAGFIEVNEGETYTIVFPWNYPVGAPLVLRRAEGTEHQVACRWSLNPPETDRLLAAIGGLADRSGQMDRLAGVVPRSVSDREVLVVGAGSVGSAMVDMLVRSGVERFTLVDPDAVETSNLSRSVYLMDDVGVSKVDALADHIRRVNPAARVTTVAAALQDVATNELHTVIGRASLVVAATDDPEAQLRLNHHAYAVGVPAMFPGIYARGRGGEVVVSLPGATPCFRCATAARQGGHRPTSRDYGSGRLVAEPALGADILHVATAAAKLALGLLVLDETEGDLVDFVVEGVATGSYVVFGNVARYWFLEDIFADVGAQYAYQSVWMRVAGRPDCPVCGVEETRTDPTDLSTVTPNFDALVIEASGVRSA